MSQRIQLQRAHRHVTRATRASVHPHRTVAKVRSFDDKIFCDFPLERDTPLVCAGRASAIRVYESWSSLYRGAGNYVEAWIVTGSVECRLTEGQRLRYHTGGNAVTGRRIGQHVETHARGGRL